MALILADFTVNATDANITLGANSPNVLLTGFTAGRDVTLPTVFKAGKVLTIASNFYHLVTVKVGGSEVSLANGCNATASFAGGNDDFHVNEFGYVTLLCLQNNPSAVSHWRVLDCLDMVQYAATAAGANTNVINITLLRRLNDIQIAASQTPMAAIGSNLAISASGTNMPTRMRPSITSWGNAAYILRNGDHETIVAYVETSGDISWYNRVAFTTGQNCGVTPTSSNKAFFSYRLEVL